ncbi:MAG TPA: hypothetical protein ENI94_05540 [Gammaproteobacteria bacterium]|nr:hypothetical protein [Gammaproteobacteria bacterium]
MAGNTLEGLLTIPHQLQPGSDSFPTRPKQVETWVASLPMANIGECARQIYTALGEMNRLIISPQDRFKSLETLRPPLFVITETLKKHYIRQNLPLSPRNQKIAELAIQLNSEMAMGYKSVIEDTLAKSFSRLKMKSIGISIHRAMHYLSNMLLCAYQIYIHHPENTWLELNRLYLFAEENQLHDKKIKDVVAENDTPGSTIEDNYKQILLLALANPYGLRQHITGAIFKALREWAPACRILPFSGCEEIEGCTSINLNSDAAPGFFCDDGATNPVFCRHVDTSEMTRVISNGILSQGSGNNGIPDEVLKRLALTWGGKSRRAFSRTTSNNKITITLGLSATHHYIDEILRPLRVGVRSLCADTIENINVQPVLGTPNDSMELDRPALYTSTPVFGISNIDDHTPDIWDPDYTYRASNATYSMSANEEDDRRRKEALFTPVDCKGVNESAGGYCLLGRVEYDKDSRRVQVGELVGLNDDTSDPKQFSIGIIRRIKSWKNGLELGIQKLAPCAEAIATAAIPKDGETKKYNRSLILPELSGIKQPATIITHAWQREGDNIITNIHGQKAFISLNKMLESTGVFAQFEFTVLESEDTPADKTHSTQNAAQKEKGFDDVWSIL